MRILVVGAGAREHTLVWKLAQSPRATEVLAAPGNAGTARIARNLDIRDTDIDGLLDAVKRESMDLVVVGPEAPLAAGIVDRLQALGVAVFGPTQKAAAIESSKAFAKDLMQRYGIPCAASATFTDYAEAQAYLKRQTAPIVIKADGLAAGKGVVVAETRQQAEDALSDFMQAGRHGAAGERVVIEECLTGQEMSCFVFSDGKMVLPVSYACDYKRVYDGDRGPNTGGMGSYSPPPFLTQELAERVQETIMKPVAEAMAREGRPYRGVLYGGLMLTAEGPKVIEFNARFGDPEAQVVLPLLKMDLVDIIMDVVGGSLAGTKVGCHAGACVGVVVASGGYPGSYRTGFPITGLDDVDDDVMVFHAGTRFGSDGQVMTAGGRVLTVAALGETMATAREKAYENVARIHFDGCRYRRDIALLEQGER